MTIGKKTKNKKRTAVIIPKLERAVQEKPERRIERGTNERVLHVIGCQECTCNR
jgi:hypothetical protein